MSTQFAPQQPQFSLQFNATSVVPVEENSILIQNLNSFVTESMLHQKFMEIGAIKLITLKSNALNGLPLGRALIEFVKQDSAKEAIKRFNMRKFFEQNEEQEQKFMEVTQKLNKTKLDELKNSSKLFFKITFDTENTNIDPTEISDYLSIFGEIQQLKFKSSKGKLLDYGNIIFKNKEDKEKVLKQQEEKNFSGNGFTIQFGDYTANQLNFNLHVTEHKLISQVIPDSILKDEQKLEQERVRLEKIIKDDLQEKNLEYQSLALNISEVHKKAYFFISLKSNEAFEQISNDFKNQKAVIAVLKKGKETAEQYKNLHLKNLKVETLNDDQKKQIIDNYLKKNNVERDPKSIVDEELEERLKSRMQKDLLILGYNKVSVKISTPPVSNKQNPNITQSAKEYQETKQGTLFFSSSEEGIKFMTTYLSKPNVDTIKTWFLNDNPQGKVNILLGQADLVQYKKSRAKGAQEQYQLFYKQQTQQLIQQHLNEQNQQFNQVLNNNDSHAAPNRYQFNNRQNNNFQQQQFPNQQNPNYQNNGQRSTTYPNNQNNQGRQFIPNSRNPQGGRPYPNNQGQGYQGQRQFNNNQGGAPNQNRSYQQGPRQFNNNYQNNQQVAQPLPGQQQQQQQFGGQQLPRQQNVNQGGNQPRPIHNAPQQINQNQIQQQTVQAPSAMTIDQIRENPDDFVKKPQDLQKSILGQLIYPKVKGKLDERKEDSKTLTPKITGMLIDFTVFELEDIIEMIDNQEDLNERIEEALELIKNPAGQK